MVINKDARNENVLALISIVSFVICISTLGFATPPQIDPEGIFGLETDCIYDDFQAPLEIRDADGDSINVYSNYGTAVMSGFYVDGYGISHWQGTIEFEKDVICGESYIDTLVIDAVDEHSEVSTLHYGPINFVGTMSFSMDPSLYIWPGEDEWMPVYLDAADCFCLGGFYMAVEHDPWSTDIVDIKLNDELDNHASVFEFQEDYFGEDLDRIVFVIEPGYQYCDIDPGSPILYLKFHLNQDEYPVNFVMPVCFIQNAPYYTMNSVSDETGNSIWFPHGCDSDQLDLYSSCGNIKVLDEHNLLYGDVNLDYYPFEIGDATLAHNAALDVSNYPLNNRQRHSGDIDTDGKTLTLYDLYFFWPVINGEVEPYEDIPIPYGYSPNRDTLKIESAHLNPGEQFILPVYLINHDTLFDFQAYLVPDTSQLIIDSLVIRDSMTRQISCPRFYHLTSYEYFDCADGCDSSIYLPGTYHICDLFGSVKSEVVTPGIATVEFADDDEIFAYTGALASNYFVPVCIDSRINIGYQFLEYLPGDANMRAGNWPPVAIGGDVTYLVSYFRGIITSPACKLDNFYAAADANGDCNVVGSDVTYMVNYFRGMTSLNYCPDYPTVWPSSDYVPIEAPDGWPNCE